MSDYIVRATAANSQIRAFAAVTTDMVETARKNHNTSPVATAALGRLLTGGAMMGAMMKGEKDLLTLRIHAGGPLQGITVTADSHGNVKGYVGNPDVCIPANSKGKLDVAGAVGVGFMDVIKDMGLKEPYVGQVALQTSEIAEDLTYYFATSEQVPSAVGLGVLMNFLVSLKRPSSLGRKRVRSYTLIPVSSSNSFSQIKLPSSRFSAIVVFPSISRYLYGVFISNMKIPSGSR